MVGRPADEDPARVAAVEDPGGRPEVWTIPGTGVEWCDCGEDHELTRDVVLARYLAAGLIDGRVPHPVVVAVTMDVWGNATVCRFLHLTLEDAAREVAGAVLPDYELHDAVDITGRFTKTWQGCPEESCNG